MIGGAHYAPPQQPRSASQGAASLPLLMNAPLPNLRQGHDTMTKAATESSEDNLARIIVDHAGLST